MKRGSVRKIIRNLMQQCSTPKAIRMKNVYLMLTIVGFIYPNFYVLQESIESGNVLLWTDPSSTLKNMFENTISTAFAVDLLVVVLVFFIWSNWEANKYKMKGRGLVWLLTLLFGLGGSFPLFLFLREHRKTQIQKGMA